jgi:hypothetical protein
VTARGTLALPHEKTAIQTPLSQGTHLKKNGEGANPRHLKTLKKY